MPQKKQQFRFRIPRIIPGSRPKHRSKPPSKSGTDVPIRRPPFRPPGIAPAPPQSLPQGTLTSSTPPVSSPSPLKIKPHTTAASSSGRHTKDALWRAFHADKNKEAQESENVDIKMMFATSADPVTRNVSSSSISLENPPPQNVATVNPTQSMNEKTVSVVTLAGENRGATMHVGSQSAKKEGSIHIHRAYRTNPEEEEEKETTDGEENSCGNSMEKEDEAEKAFINSNIQSMNNSMMLHGSINGRDPGVRVILPQQHPPSLIKPVETPPKAEVKIWRADKSSYQPVVRRRCLRGLFLEPSDSEPDNPHKPRRHGCKFNCGEIRKD